MKLEQTQSLAQKLVLTQNMRQSLDCLQLSAPELSEYVQEVALSNPLLDVQARRCGDAGSLRAGGCPCCRRGS